MSYTIYALFKGKKSALLNISFSKDGSVHCKDMISKDDPYPIYEIATYELDTKNPRLNKEIEPSSQRFIAHSRVKLSHHASGFFQISGEGKKILSGIDENGNPRGVFIDSFQIKTSTNDGGPFFGGLFWGLNKIKDYKSKNSQEILFTEEDMRYQNLGGNGKKTAVAILGFHLPIARFSKEEILEGKGIYNYKNYRKPIKLTFLPKDINDQFIIGITCLIARTGFQSDFGFTLGGGSGFIDVETGKCKNAVIIYPKPLYAKDIKYASLDSSALL